MLGGRTGIRLWWRLAWPLPIGDGFLFGSRQGQGLGWRAVADHRAGANGRQGSDVDGRDQRGVGTDESLVADPGLMLIGTIIVTGDGAGTDIDLATELRITDVAQVIDLGCFGKARLFDLDEVADVAVIANLCLWT